MAIIKVKFFTTRPRKNGSLRYFWQPTDALKQAGWKLTRLPDDYAEALNAAAQINTQVDAWRAGLIDTPTTARPGTVEAVIVAYKNNREYKDLAVKTKIDYERYLTLIDNWAGPEIAATITAKMVQDLYETLYHQTPAKAAYLVRVIRVLFNFAERQSMIPKNSNPATKPKLKYRAPKGRLWSAGAVQTFVEEADRSGHFAIGTAVMLNEWIGQRRGDIIALPLSAYQKGTLRIRQSKTGAEVELAINEVPALRARIEDQIRSNLKRPVPGTTIIQQESGQPYSGDWFAHAFMDIRDRAAKACPDLAEMVFMNLRHTAITRLTEAGCTLQEVAAISGHSFKAVQDIVDRYNVRTAKAARTALLKRVSAERL